MHHKPRAVSCLATTIRQQGGRNLEHVLSDIGTVTTIIANVITVVVVVATSLKKGGVLTNKLGLAFISRWIPSSFYKPLVTGGFFVV